MYNQDWSNSSDAKGALTILHHDKYLCCGISVNKLAVGVYSQNSVHEIFIQPTVTDNNIHTVIR